MTRLSIHRTVRFHTVVLVALALCGCRGQSTAMTNPFMAPDRVPPPSTRAIAPGTAQPYYPGDPLPAMQGAVPPGAPPIAAAQTAPPPTPPNTPPPGGAPSTPPPPAQLSFSNERSVAIPADNADLRFPLPRPAPPSQPQPSVAATQPPPAAGPAGAAATAAPPANPISLASYTEGANDITPIGAEEPAAGGMWRSPQVSRGGAVQASHTAPVAAPQAPVPMTPPPMPIENPNPMPVQLRAVTPPPNPQVLQPSYNPPPRMRFPNFFGWPQAQPQPTPVPQPTPAPVQTAAPAGTDGFRARTKRQ